jgi:hypothetical protein
MGVRIRNALTSLTIFATLLLTTSCTFAGGSEDESVPVDYVDAELAKKAAIYSFYKHGALRTDPGIFEPRIVNVDEAHRYVFDEDYPYNDYVITIYVGPGDIPTREDLLKRVKKALNLEEEYIHLDGNGNWFLRDSYFPETTLKTIREILYEDGYYYYVHIAGTKKGSPSILQEGFSPLIRYYYVTEAIAEKCLRCGELEREELFICRGNGKYWMGYQGKGEKIYIPIGYEPIEHSKMKISDESELKEYIGKTLYPPSDLVESPEWGIIEEKIIPKGDSYEILDSRLMGEGYSGDELGLYVPNYEQTGHPTGYPARNDENWG